MSSALVQHLTVRIDVLTDVALELLLTDPLQFTEKRHDFLMELVKKHGSMRVGNPPSNSALVNTNVQPKS